MVSWTAIASAVFLCYILNSVWTVYKLYVLPPCVRGEPCIASYLRKNSDFCLLLYQSPDADARNTRAMVLLDKWKQFDYTEPTSKTVTVNAIDAVRRNRTLYAHVLLVPERLRELPLGSLVQHPHVAKAHGPLTKYAIPEAKSFNLLGDSKGSDDDDDDAAAGKGTRTVQPYIHWQNSLFVEIVKDAVSLPVTGLPREIIKYLRLTDNAQYLPPLYVDTLSTRIKHLQLVEKTSDAMNVTVYYSPVSFGKLRLWTQLEAAMATMMALGFTEKDVDEVKGIFTDTNFYLLCTTFTVAALHLMFDVLAFKNDIVFWSKKKTMVGLSSRTVVWRCVSHFIIFLYLLDEQTSLLVLVPTGIGALIEMWKVCKAFKVKVIWQGRVPTLEFGSRSDDEKATEKYDAQIMRTLSYLLYPLCVCGAGYSLLYMPHKSWYSWTVQSLVNGVYGFGFLFMLPQLFLNYKSKSVAHLPWRAFMYKAFNTFIDDIFAFVVTMPTAHRVACFRDDVVFLIYLYQRWLYPVDLKRVNEFGDSFEDDKKKKSN